MASTKSAKELNLTVDEEQAIHDTWSILAKDLRGCGARFFIYLFGIYPHFQPMFRSFAKVPLEELAQNKRFQAHGYTVMSAIDGFIENLDDIEMLRELLLKQGHNHARRKLTVADFAVVESALTSFFEQELGEEFTSVTASAWAKVCKAVVSIIIEGINEFNNEQNNQ